MICARGDCHKVVGESLNTVGANRVRTNHHAQVVALEERVQVVGAKVHDIVLLLWISYVVMLEAILFLSLMVLVDWLDETFFGLDYHSKFAVVIGVILTLDKDHHGV